MQRSQKYDWFKGNQNKDKKKDFKQGAKTTWKFAKIFLIFVVLFISLWGCVQGFIIKQSNFVGKGTEFYLNEETIPPHITEFKEDEVTVGADKIYSLEKTDKNVWLNREDKSLLKPVHDELIKQGLSSMADAYKGVNEAVRIVQHNGSSSGSAIVKDNTGVPIVMSTASTKVATWSKSAMDINTVLNMTGVANADTGILWLTDLTDKANSTDGKVHSSVQKMRNNAITAPIAGSRDEFRVNFRNKIFESLNTNNWMTNALTLAGPFAKLKGTITNGVAPITGVADLEKLYNAARTAQDRALSVLNYLGYSFKEDKVEQPSNDFVPSQGGDTYIPIVTWEQAWVRGVGPFYGLVVFPVSKFTTLVADAFPFMSGWETLFAMVIVIFALRFLGFLVSFKSTLQQTRMQELNLKKAAIDAKYAPYKGNKQMQARQRQEVSEMYKKEGVSPLGAFTNTLIVMPLFLAIWRVIGSTPHIKSTTWYGINFSATSWRELFHGDFIYLPLMILAVGMSIGSQLFPKLLTRKRDKLRGNAHLKQAMKKGNKMQIIIMIITTGMSLIFSAGLQVYWIVVSIWTIIQSYATHEIIKCQHKKVRKKAAA